MPQLAGTISAIKPEWLICFMQLFDQLYHLLSRSGLWEEEKLLPRHAFLTQPGYTDTRLYYVTSGSLRVFIADELEEHTIRFGYRNSFMSALDSHISEQPTELYIQALKKSSLLSISKQAFSDWKAECSENLGLWHKILESFVYQQMEREHDLLISSPELRYRRVLDRSPQLFQEIPQKYIANYLRMSPETLSRLKKS